MIRIDARRLDPPEPFERVVDALSTLPEGEEVLLILEREPLPLYRFLRTNGYVYQSTTADGCVEIRIREDAKTSAPD